MYSSNEHCQLHNVDVVHPYRLALDWYPDVIKRTLTCEKWPLRVLQILECVFAIGIL
jgi:hypothetical protein